MKKVFIIVISAVFIFTSNSYAEVAVETSVSSDRVSIGEEVNFDITITNASGPISQPSFSSIDGFSSYSQGHSQEISMINGQMSSKSVFSYVLIANSEGKKTIGPFDIVIGSKTYKTPPIQVEILPAGASPSRRAPAYAQGPIVSPVNRALPSNGPTKEDIFVKSWLDKDEVFVNEPVMLTYTLYTRLSATYKGFEKEPQTTGFWIEDFPPEKTINRTEKIFNNSRYVVADVRKIALFPTEPGVFTIDTGVLSTMVEMRNQSEDDFDSFFSSSIFGHRSFRFPSGFASQVVPKTVPANSVHLTVKALPAEGKPANFTGAVGKFEIQSALDKAEIEEGTPLSYRVKVRGIGNINTIQTPILGSLPDFKIYDSSSSVNISKNRLLVEGEKVTETVLVPKKAGVYTIPSLSFSFFDPQSKIYKTILTPPHTLAVKPAPKTEEAQNPAMTMAPVEKENISLTGKDIRYIKEEDHGKNIPRISMDKNPFYWAINGLLFFALLFLKLFSGSARNLLDDPKGERYRRSHRVARQKLNRAHQLLKREKADEFYAELSRAVYGYFGDKLNVSPQSVTTESIENFLRTAHYSQPQELMRHVKDLVDRLAQGRFGGTANDEASMRDIYRAADQVISDFERVRSK